MLKADFRAAVSNADILLAPHHGRKSGFDIDFVNLVNPRLTIVSDGRFCDSSANGRYSEKSRGWKVHHRSGNISEDRYCLTTNSDGHVELDLGYNGDQPFLSVSID